LPQGLFGTAVDLGLAQGAKRMVDDDWGEIGHAERVPLHQRFV
jgi:hypothetical protein